MKNKLHRPSKYRTPLLWSIGTALFSSVVLEGSRAFIRPVLGKGQGVIPELLGLLPNLLAGFGTPFLFLGAYCFCMAEFERTAPQALQSIEFSSKKLKLAFTAVTVVNAMGLVLWEFKQINTNLVFDHLDIVATLVGMVFSIYFFYRSILVTIIDASANI